MMSLVVAFCMSLVMPTPATEWNLGGIYRDGALLPSPDGRFAIVSVRRRDTNGDGRISTHDWKSLLLMENGREVAMLADACLAWQDKMARWSPDGRSVVLALPMRRPGWTPYESTDIVIYDPVTRRERVRYRDGINPVWLWDDRIAFQRGNDICVAGRETVVVIPIPASERENRLLRLFAPDPWHRRIVASYSGLSSVRARTAEILRNGKPSVMLAMTETRGGWRVERLPWDGYEPRPAAEGLYYYARRGDVSGNGTYEVMQDGVNLMRDGAIVLEDAVFHSFFDYVDLRATLVRREGGFRLVQLDTRGQPVGILADGLEQHGNTWLAAAAGHFVMSAVKPGDLSGPSLYMLAADGTLCLIARGPLTQPQVTARGVLVIRATDQTEGVIVEIPWNRMP